MPYQSSAGYQAPKHKSQVNFNLVVVSFLFVFLGIIAYLIIRTETKGIAKNAVSTTNVEDSSITGDKISVYTISDNNLGSNSVTEHKIMDNNVTKAKIAPDAVGASEIDETSDITVKTLTSTSYTQAASIDVTSTDSHSIDTAGGIKVDKTATITGVASLDGGYSTTYNEISGTTADITATTHGYNKVNYITNTSVSTTLTFDSDISAGTNFIFRSMYAAGGTPNVIIVASGKTIKWHLLEPTGGSTASTQGTVVSSTGSLTITGAAWFELNVTKYSDSTYYVTGMAYASSIAAT